MMLVFVTAPRGAFDLCVGMRFRSRVNGRADEMTSYAIAAAQVLSEIE